MNLVRFIYTLFSEILFIWSLMVISNF